MTTRGRDTLYATTLPPPLIKTPTYSSIYNYRGTRSTITPLTLLLITSTPGSTNTTTAGTEYIRVYLVIAIFIRINITCSTSELATPLS